MWKQVILVMAGVRDVYNHTAVTECKHTNCSTPLKVLFQMFHVVRVVAYHTLLFSFFLSTFCSELCHILGPSKFCSLQKHLRHVWMYLIPFYAPYHYQLKLLYFESVLSRPHGTPGALLLGTDSVLGVTWGTSFLGFRLPDRLHNTEILLEEMRTSHSGGEGAVPGQKAAKSPSNSSFLLPLVLSCCCTNIIPCSVTAVTEQKAVQVGGRGWLLRQCLSSSAISGSLSL